MMWWCYMMWYNMIQEKIWYEKYDSTLRNAIYFMKQCCEIILYNMICDMIQYEIYDTIQDIWSFDTKNDTWYDTTIQYVMIQRNMIQFMIWYDTMLWFNVILYEIYNTIWYDRIRHDTIWYNTIQCYDTRYYDTIYMISYNVMIHYVIWSDTRYMIHYKIYNMIL